MIQRGQSNNQDILHLMMTPIFYLWNPYNIEIEMDSHDENWVHTNIFTAQLILNLPMMEKIGLN